MQFSGCRKMDNRAVKNTQLLARLSTETTGTPGFADVMARLWENNLPLIRRTVHSTTGLTASDLDYEDMQQEAYISFQAAALTYSAGAADCSFTTFFVHRIRWDLIRYYSSNGFSIRIPEYMKQIIRNVFDKKRQLEAQYGVKTTYEAAIKALGLSPGSAPGILAAIQRIEIISTDATQGGTDEDGLSLLEKLKSSEDVEESAIVQEWHRELHILITKALRDLPEDAQHILFRHFFQGVSYVTIAREMQCTRQSIDKKRGAAFRQIRAGGYAQQLTEFLPDMSAKRRADRYILQTKAEIEKLQLTCEEKELMAI